MLSYVVLIAACVICLGFGSYLYCIVTSKCIKGSLLSIGRCNNNQKAIFNQFIEFIKFHSHVKQLSKIPHQRISFRDEYIKEILLKMLQNLKKPNSSFFYRWISKYLDIIEPFLTLLFLWSLITICGAFLMIQTQLVQYLFSTRKKL